MRTVLIAGLTALLLLTGCSKENRFILGPQPWGELLVMVETRPSPPRVGMNEFILIVTEESGRPGFDLVASLRMNNQGKWRQAIPDGNIGVYRKAIEISSLEKDVLYVMLQNRNKEEVLLEFPLNQPQKMGEK